MAVEGRGEAVMDKVTWLGLVYVWCLTLALVIVGVWDFYVGRLGDGCILALLGIPLTYISIDLTKMIWRRKNEAHD